MSSFVGHMAAGAAVFLAHHRLSERPVRWALPVLVFLAISPDLDYLPRWLWHLHPATRFTHSLLFCVAIGVLVWLLCTPLRRRQPQALTLGMALLASTSHVLLDTLVGAHPEPLLWPFSATEILWPLGLLPSAGHLHWANPYLWRNLLIESGVLWPVLALGVALARGVPLHRRRPDLWWALVPAWAAFLGWSVAVH
jgi:inner membrane protein